MKKVGIVKIKDLTENEKKVITGILQSMEGTFKNLYMKGFMNGLFAGTILALAIFFVVQMS